MQLHARRIGLHAGEQFKRLYGLEYGHAAAGHGAAALGLRRFQQRGLQREVDDLRNPLAGPQQFRRQRQAGGGDAAGLAVGFWSGLDDLSANWQEDKRWTPSMDEAERARLDRNWKKAVTKTLDWVDDDVE